jgi:hypothetical protein
MLSRFAPLFQFQVSTSTLLCFYGSKLETVTQKASTSDLESTVEVGEVEVVVEIEPEPIRVDTKLDTS